MPGRARTAGGLVSGLSTMARTGASSSSAAATRAPLPRSLGWSIAVVLAAGVLAVVTIPEVATQTVLQQGAGPALPAAADPGAAPGPDTTAVAGPETAALAATGPASTSSSAPAASPTAAKPKASAATRAAPTAPPKTAPAAAPARLQPSPGTYPLHISGTSSVAGRATAVPTSGSLVVESRGGDQQLRTVGVPGGLVLVQRANAAGLDLVSFSLTAGSKTLSFSPPAPLAFVRTNPGSWSWSAGSTDGTVTLNQTATVSSAGSVNVGGTSVPAVRVSREFTVSGAVQGTVRLTSTVSLADRLPLVQHQVINVTGKALGGLVSTTVASESTATLTSTSPR